MNSATEGKNSFQIIEEKVGRLKVLLKDFNHFWAVRVSYDIIELIDKSALGTSVHFHVYNELIEAWENYIRVLVNDFFDNWPLISYAYNQLFHILFIIKDFHRIKENGVKLAKNLVKIQFASNDQIANFLESLALITFHSKDFRDAIELLYLAIYFRGTYMRSDTFDTCFTILDNILQKIPPVQRSNLLYCFLDNAFRSFFVGIQPAPQNETTAGDPKSPKPITFEIFIDIIYRASINAANPMLRDGLSQVKRTFTQMRDYSIKGEELKELIDTLQMLNEHSWALLVISYKVYQLLNENNNSEAKEVLKHFIDLSFRKGAYSTSIQGYYNLTKLIPTEGKRFNPEIVQIWITACWNFRKLEDKSYFAEGMEKLKNYLQIPEDSQNFADFCNASNEYYKIKRGYINTSPEDFWWAILYRSIFEEGLEDIANLSARKLKIFAHPGVKELFINQLPKTIQTIQEKQKAIPDISVGGMPPKNIIVIIRIARQKPVKIYTGLVYGSDMIEERLNEIQEIWDDSYLEDLYFQMGTSNKKSQGKESINPPEFGKIAYLSLPLEMRVYNLQLRYQSGIMPELQLIMDHPIVPFEMIKDNKSPLGVKFGVGYRFKEPPLTKNYSDLPLMAQSLTADETKKINILNIGDLNVEIPKIWNEEKKKNLNLLAIPNRNEILQSFLAKIKDLSYKLERFESLNHMNCTREKLAELIGSGQFHIIHFASSLFFIENSPLDSYWISPDNQIISIYDILKWLSEARKKVKDEGYIRPLLILNGPVLNQEFEIIPRSFKAYSAISQILETKHILGILARISSEWNEYLQDFFLTFMERVILGETIGSALITAHRQQFVRSRSLGSDEEMQKIFNLLQETHFLYFGIPWNKLE